MKFGVLLPHAGHAADPDGLLAVADAAERLGFDSIWVGDHILMPRATSDYPYVKGGQYPLAADRPFLEAFSTLAYVASATSRVKLGVSVAVVPHRPPGLLAKLVATLDFLSRGRFVLGAAAGWSRTEIEALGMPFDRRGAFTDETLSFCRAAWSSPDGCVSFRGNHVQVEDMYVMPRPPQGDKLPIWVGGISAAAKRRAAAVGTAWHPTINVEPSAMRDGLAEVRAMAAERGRDDHEAIELTVSVPIAFDAAGGGKWPGALSGDAATVAERVDELAAAGATQLVLLPRGSARRRIEFMERFMAEVLPNLSVAEFTHDAR